MLPWLRHPDFPAESIADCSVTARHRKIEDTDDNPCYIMKFGLLCRVLRCSVVYTRVWETQR